MKNRKEPIIFPWIELIPIVLYVLAWLYIAAPSSVLAQSGLMKLGFSAIPLAAIAGITMSVIGFVMLSRLRGWRKAATLAASILNLTAFGLIVFGAVYLISRLLNGGVI